MIELKDDNSLVIKATQDLEIEISSEDVLDLTYQIELRSAKAIIKEELRKHNEELPTEEDMEILANYYLDTKDEFAEANREIIMRLIISDLIDEKYTDDF